MSNRLTLVAIVLGLMCASAAVSFAQNEKRRVQADARVFIEPTENGMHTALAGAFTKKKVPVMVVTTAEKADYIITVVGDYKKAGWARQLMTGSRGDSNASMTVAHRESGEVVYAYNVDKSNAVRGIQSAAEACAKHLGNHIKGKE